MEELSAFILREINFANTVFDYPRNIEHLWHLYTLTCKTYTEEDSINQLK